MQEDPQGGYAASPSPAPVEESFLRPDPNDPSWGMGLGLLIWVVSILAIIVIPLIFVLPYLLSSGINLRDGEVIGQFVKSDQNAVILQLASILPAHLITLLIAYLVVTRFRTRPFIESLGWRSGGIRALQYVYIFLGLFAFAAAVSYFVPELPNDFTEMLKTSRTATLIVAFIATFTAPFGRGGGLPWRHVSGVPTSDRSGRCDRRRDPLILRRSPPAVLPELGHNGRSNRSEPRFDSAAVPLRQSSAQRDLAYRDQRPTVDIFGS